MVASAFEHNIWGTTTLTNTSSVLTFGEAVVDIISSLPQSKALDQTLFDATAATSIRLDPGASTKLPFKLTIPPTLDPQQELYIRLRLDSRVILKHALTPPPALHLTPIAFPPDPCLEYQKVYSDWIRVRITNSSSADHKICNQPRQD